MKGSLFAVLALALVGANAQAERYILKNPTSSLVTAQAIKSFEFGKDKYVVVNAPRFSSFEASLSQSAEEVMIDYKIGVPATRPGKQVQDSKGAWWWDEKPTKAWHPGKMKYDELPADRDGRERIVAVLDTGVDYNHKALKDHVWTNTKEIAGNGVDDDGNGYVDDVHGYDFEGNDSDPMDGDAHGTHCAGVIAGGLDDASGARGVAPGAKVMAVRIIGNEQTGFMSDAVEGIKYAVDNGATVLSNSWRVYRSWSSYNPSDENVELMRKAIEYAGSKGAVFVAAAGNESKNMDSMKDDPMWPGGYEGLANLVVVAASDADDQPAYFSNYGIGHVMVAAPGSDIISTVPGNKWQSMSGTSMATPLVAGSIARGLGAGFGPEKAIAKMMDTSLRSDSWKSKVKAGGTIQLVDYLRD
jgi:subtilisin family serine protease